MFVGLLATLHKHSIWHHGHASPVLRHCCQSPKHTNLGSTGGGGGGGKGPSFSRGPGGGPKGPSFSGGPGGGPKGPSFSGGLGGGPKGGGVVVAAAVVGAAPKAAQARTIETEGTRPPTERQRPIRRGRSGWA